MSYIVGIDEAGYGPALGPLVISATLWHVDEGPSSGLGLDLYARLADVVSAQRPADARLWLADSKCVYGGSSAKSSGVGNEAGPRPNLRWLELGVLTCLAAAHGRHPVEWAELWETVAGGDGDDLRRQPWHRERPCPLPVSVASAEIASCVERWHAGASRQGVRLAAVRSRALFADDFNRQVALRQGKGDLLSRLSLELAAGMLGEVPPEPTLFLFDKHGGRNNYHALLQEQFAESWIQVHCEGRELSRYGWRELGRSMEARFCVRGESHLPVALASMTSKYVREVAMGCFNAFWQERLPGLALTAGYTVDARRFKQEIAAVQAELGIEDGLLWEVLLMKLYIVRHAWAEDPDDERFPEDMLRPLTVEGRQRFEQVAARLSGYGFAPTLLATSPALRCRQTAEILAGALPNRPEIVVCEALAPGSQLAEMASWTRGQPHEEIAWVGHAPDVGLMTSRLIGDDGGQIRFAKGAVAAIVFDKKIRVGEGELNWLATAKILGV